jgi:NADH dehydrogenase (ubiquinone) 1 alpha subcomplex subunit 9
VTVFGCTGFLGRYVVNKLARKGTQVVVPFRGEDDEKRHLKLMGDLGQVVPLRFDLRDPASLVECVRHSDTVYNLIGRDYQTKHVHQLQCEGM